MVDLTKNSGPNFDSNGNLLVAQSGSVGGQSLALLANVSATGAGTAMTWAGGSGLFAVNGTFGGCTVNLEWLGPNGVWMTLGSVTSATPISVGPIPAGTNNVRAEIVGGTPSSIYATLAS